MTKTSREAEDDWLKQRAHEDAQIDIESAARSDAALTSTAVMIISWLTMQAFNLIAFDKLQMSLEEMATWEKGLQIVEIPIAIFLGRLIGTLTYEDRSML